MKKIIYLIVLLSITSCSSYVVKIESPKTWFDKNLYGKQNEKIMEEKEKEEQYPNVKNKLQELKENKNIINLKETKTYTEVEQEKPAEKEYSLEEELLINYITSKVNESRSQVERIIITDYEKVKDRMTLSEYLNNCLQYIKNTKAQNFTLISKRVINR